MSDSFYELATGDPVTDRPIDLHLHDESCQHRMVPHVLPGVSVCDSCDDRYMAFEFCPDRCPAEAALHDRTHHVLPGGER